MRPYRARAHVGFGQACQIAVKDGNSDAGARVGKTNTSSPPEGSDSSIIVQLDALHALVITGHLSRCWSGVQISLVFVTAL